VFDEDVADTFEWVEDSGDVINDDMAAQVRRARRTVRAVEGLPFATENAHHACA
jgi:hypothetical protein